MIELIDRDAGTSPDETEAQAELLRTAIACGEPGSLAHAIGVIARARGMSNLERQTGVNRQALYRALDTNGNPTLKTVMKVLDALELQIRIEPKPVDCID